MILKKTEENNLIKALYASSNICASTYNTENSELIITFNNGGQYAYSNVSKTDYTRFEMAESQGLVFGSHIKKYSFTKLDKINTNKLLSEVAELKNKIKENNG
jgi:hypothetical protein